jgi:hypothetical protein
MFESIKEMKFAVKWINDKIVKQKLFVSTDNDAICGEKWPTCEKQIAKNDY